MSTIPETRKPQNSKQQVVIICRRLTAPDQPSKITSTPTGFEMIHVASTGGRLKTVPRVAKKRSTGSDKVVSINGTNRSTKTLTKCAVGSGPVRDEIVNYHLSTVDIGNVPCDSAINKNNANAQMGSLLLRNNNNNMVSKIKEDPNVDSVGQFLVPLRDPLTNRIKNTLVPIETHTDSSGNAIKSISTPSQSTDGNLSHDGKKVVLPMRLESGSQRKDSENGLWCDPSNPAEEDKGRNNQVALCNGALPRVQEQEKGDASIIILFTRNGVPRAENGKQEGAGETVTSDNKRENQVAENTQRQEMQGDPGRGTRGEEREKNDEVEGASSEAVQLKGEIDEMMQDLKTSCPVCLKVLKSEKLMRRHLRTIHEKTFSCDKCGKCYVSKQGLQDHQKTHEENYYLECAVCHLRYKRPAGLRYHQIRVHSNVEPRYMCDYCGRRYKLKLDLGLHIEKTHLNPTHICKICGKVVKNISYHELQHEKLVRRASCDYRCHLCTKKFTTQTNLDNHLLLHKDGFKCHRCGEIFAAHSMLARHRLTKHKTGTACNICKKMFYRSSSLYQHVLTHAGIRPYRCDVCGEDFTQRSSVVRHRKTHPGPLPPFTETITIANLAKHVLQKLK